MIPRNEQGVSSFWNMRIGRGTLIVAGAAATGAAVIGGPRLAKEALAYFTREADPYEGMTIPEYLSGRVAIDLNVVNIRIAPNLSPQSLRINNPEGRIERAMTGLDPIPTPRGIKVIDEYRAAVKVERVQGDIVAINGTDLGERKSNGRILITNPAIVRGQNPDQPSQRDGAWIVLNTRIEVPHELWNAASSPYWGTYKVIERTYYVNFGTQTAEAVKLVDANGNPIDTPATFVPVVMTDNGRHQEVSTQQPVKDFGKVVVPPQTPR